MTIFEKVLEIYGSNYICPYCLGRMFSLLGTNVTNFERGNSLLLSLVLEWHGKYLSKSKDNLEVAIKNLKLLAENANYLNAQKVLKNEGIEFNLNTEKKECYLCHDIFSNLDIYAKKAVIKVNDIEFDNLLVGTSPNPEIINQEDRFKGKFQLLDAESFKSHFNREIGKMIAETLDKPAEFNNPDIVIVYDLDFDIDKVEINLKIRSLFIYGRYKKLIRGIPQTHWDCRSCRGSGCEKCNFTGKQYQTSVEELINKEFIKEAKATSSKFHGAGREDIDVRMLGNGRPFVLELKESKIRKLDLEKIRETVNEINKDKVEITDLMVTNKKKVIKIKTSAEVTKKVYEAVIQSETNIDLKVFQEKVEEVKKRLKLQTINQRTPERVSHRRADIIRKKMIFNIEGKYLEPNLYEFIIETQGGTYIKELISGDNGRTTPSISEIFGFPLLCKYLDVKKIDQ